MKGRGSKGGGKKRKSGRGARFGGVGVGGVEWDRGSQGPLSRGPAAIRAKEARRMKGRERREVRRREREEERSGGGVGVGVGGGGGQGQGGWDRGSQGPLSRGPAAIRAKEAQRMERGEGER